MAGTLGHERQITFFPNDGHDHDGQNSSPVKLQSGQVELQHLDSALLELILNGGDSGEGEEGAAEGDGFIPVPDLTIETNTVGAGASVTGTIPWTGVAVVRFMRVFMSTDTECTITFYHLPTFADEDREFRAFRCSNKFLWEGAWVHYDENMSGNLYYKIENTGLAAARFQLILKSGTMVANGYADFVQSIQKMGSSTAPFIGPILFEAGNGVNITPTAGTNSFRFDAVAPETIHIDRYAEAAILPTGVSSSATLVYNTGGSVNQLDGITTDTNRYVVFGVGSQWIQYDFGNIYTASRIVAIGYYGDTRSYNAVRIDRSHDGLNWQTLYGPTTTRMSGPPGMSIYMPTGILTRYVRVYMNGSSLNTNNHMVKCILYAQSNKVGS
jgi:hypothetical protein